MKSTIFLPLLLLGFYSYSQTTLIPYNASWKFLDNGSDPGNAWISNAYNDTSWKSGPAELGYGDGDEATTVSYGGNKRNRYVTTYFRTSLNIPDTAQFMNYTATVFRDDGAVVYVNGTEVFRTNMPAGTTTYRTKAFGASNDDGNVPHTFVISASAFINGQNSIAVEVHQSSTTSSDVSFKLQLVAEPVTGDVTAPVVNSILRHNPIAQNTSVEEVSFALHFSEAVTGIDEDDFLLNTAGGTATGTVETISGSGTDYTVLVINVAGEGPLQLQVRDSGSGITDLAGNVLSSGFATGESYMITALDETAPVVAGILRKTPLAPTTSLQTVVFTLNFSEAVNGLDAADLTLVTSGATTASIESVSGSAAAYTVTVGNISGAGSLRLDVADAGTSITDAAGNALSGGFSTGEIYTIVTSDVSPPEVTTINRLSPLTETTSATSVTFRVTFSEAVQGVNLADFTAVADQGALFVTTQAVLPVSGNDRLYDVQVAVSGNGILQLNLKNSGTGITDNAGNAISAGFTEGETYTIQQPVGQPDAVLTRGPYLQMASGSAVTLRWRTDVATNSRIEVGTTYGTYTLGETNTTASREHEIRITGLVAGTKYFYRFGSTSQFLQAGADNFFTTAPPASSSAKLRIAAFGDCGRANSTQAAVLNAYLDQVGNNPAELMLLLGDNAYADGTDNEYQTEFFDRYKNTILKNHVLFPSPGNHDYHTTTKAQRTAPYYKNFTMPTAAECGGVPSGTKAFYSFDWGNIHFVSLDSYGEEAGATRLYDTLGPQATWVKQDLAANTKKWTIVFFHHPPFTKGSHDADNESELGRIRRNFIRILERYGVDLVLSGHSHVYERSYLLRDYFDVEAGFNKNNHTVSSSSARYDGSSNSCPYTTSSGQANHGTVYVVAGSAARSGSGVASSFPHAALPFATKDGGMFYFEVEGNRLDGKMISENGEVFDQFTILKDVNKAQMISSAAGALQTLTASWVGSYRWSSGQTTRSITVSPNSSSSYTVRDDNNCLEDEFRVNVVQTTALLHPATDAVLGKMTVTPTILKRGERIRVQLNDNVLYDADILDVNGRIMHRQKINGSGSLETASLAPGSYFIRLWRKNKPYQVKVTIVN